MSITIGISPYFFQKLRRGKKYALFKMPHSTHPKMRGGEARSDRNGRRM